MKTFQDIKVDLQSQNKILTEINLETKSLRIPNKIIRGKIIRLDEKF